MQQFGKCSETCRAVVYVTSMAMPVRRRMRQHQVYKRNISLYGKAGS